MNPKSWSESQLKSLPRFANREVSTTQIRTEFVELYMLKMSSKSEENEEQYSGI